MSVPMKSQTVEDSHAAFLPEGLYFAMDILTGYLVSLFPNLHQFQYPFLLCVLGLFIVLFLPVYFPHMLLGREEFIAWSYLDRTIAQITSTSLQTIDSVPSEYQCPFNVCILITYTHKHISAVLSRNNSFNAKFKTPQHSNSHNEINVLHWRQIL